MAVTAIITGMSPVTAKASDGVYTVEEVSDRISYQEAFSGIDDAMANWGTNIFTVSDPSGDTYWGLCAVSQTKQHQEQVLTIMIQQNTRKRYSCKSNILVTR